MKVVLKKILALIFLIIGFAGLFLPLLPGVIFLVLGLSLLGKDIKFINKIKSFIRARFPSRKAESPE